MTVCSKCKESIPNSWTVQCDRCDDSVHFGCAGLTRDQVNDIINFFCDRCRNKTRLCTWLRVGATREQKQTKLHEYYEVEDINDHHVVGSERQFLVEWKNCPVKNTGINECSWEPERNLDGAIDVLQHYCMEKSIELSSIQGLMGAGSDSSEHNRSNWVSMTTLLNMFTKVRRWLKLESALGVAEYNGLSNESHLYFLRHNNHCFVLLHDITRKAVLIADGGNQYIKNNSVASEIRERLKIRLIPLPSTQQLKVDHCVSSAILIGIEMLRMHTRGVHYQELLTTEKWLRTKLVGMLHKELSNPEELPPLRQRRKTLECHHCGKTFKSNQARALSLHMIKAHKSQGKSTAVTQLI